MLASAYLPKIPLTTLALLSKNNPQSVMHQYPKLTAPGNTVSVIRFFSAFILLIIVPIAARNALVDIRLIPIRRAFTWLNFPATQT